MPDILRTGLSGLLAFQRALTTTGNNIANANTPGYSRQRVDLSARRPEGFGYGFVGTGVDVVTIRRIVDQFAINQSRTADSAFGRFDTFSNYATQVDNILGDPSTGLSSGLTTFFNAWQDVANDPASLSSRQALVSQAEAIADRFRSTASRLDTIASDVNARIGGAVRDINQLATSIASLNADILDAAGVGQPPNDLIDQRDSLLGELAKITNITVLEEGDGALNVFIGNGQALVLRSQALGVTTAQNAFDPSQLDIVYQGANGNQVITAGMKGGGELGGLLDVRANLLDPARNSLGQLATALAVSVNTQHREGMNLLGTLGSDLFSVGAPQSLGNPSNLGSGTVATAVSDIGGLTNDEYILRFNAGTYSLVRASNGQAVTMTGTGTTGDPFRAEGLSIVVGGTPTSGDSFLLRPTRDAAASLRSVVTDPRAIAAAAPIRSSVGATNTGGATISAGEVLNVNPALTNGVTIQFLSPTTYSVNGSGSFTYASGGNIDINGWRVQITGTPAVGDTFTVQSNAGGVGDNRNALLLGGLQGLGVLAGGTQSIGEGFSGLVGQVGAQTRQASLNRDAQEAIASHAHEQVLAASGVNLDEEAADMLRWQQAYQAAAHTITVADEMFRTLISMLGR